MRQLELLVIFMERLTAQDLMNLWPDEFGWPMDIGAVAILDGTRLIDPDGRFKIDAAREAIAWRLHLVPRFRQQLYTPQRGLGGPLWVDAQGFDLAAHVGVFRLSPPADEAQLLLAVEQLRARRFDRSRIIAQPSLERPVSRGPAVLALECDSVETG